MENKEKKIAAAFAAVAAFMQEEEQALNQQLAAAMAPPMTQAPAAMLNLWGQSGRQNMMQMRSLMQLKALYR
jgi:hypothetical protein